jgi:hypothetical protein
MEIQYKIQRNTKVFNTVCMQNTTVTEDIVQIQYAEFLDREITFILPSYMRLPVYRILQRVNI